MRKKQISSAGLVYFHLCGQLLEGNEICWEQINSYCYFEKGFYSVVKEKFIKTFLKVYWLDRTEKQRKKMLSDAYDTIVPPTKADEE